jgi:ferredoxin-NADP reductase
MNTQVMSSAAPVLTESTVKDRLPWRRAVVVAVTTETATARTLILDVPGWPGHRAGQHVDVRLTAEDGYQTQRSYSIASEPEALGNTGRLMLMVQRLEDGEVSPYLTSGLRRGDLLELRGPIGGHFTWEVGLGGPLLLVGGGSGIVPLMAMLRHRAAAGGSVTKTRLLYSVRSLEEAVYRYQLARLTAADSNLSVVLTLTRQAPADWSGYRRRVDREMLAEIGFPPSENPHVFVCGSTPIVETVAAELVSLGHAPERIKTERFGPTGDAS